MKLYLSLLLMILISIMFQFLNSRSLIIVQKKLEVVRWKIILVQIYMNKC